MQSMSISLQWKFTHKTPSRKAKAKESFFHIIPHLNPSRISNQKYQIIHNLAILMIICCHRALSLLKNRDPTRQVKKSARSRSKSRALWLDPRKEGFSRALPETKWHSLQFLEFPTRRALTSFSSTKPNIQLSKDTLHQHQRRFCLLLSK